MVAVGHLDMHFTGRTISAHLSKTGISCRGSLSFDSNDRLPACTFARKTDNAEFQRSDSEEFAERPSANASRKPKISDGSAAILRHMQTIALKGLLLLFHKVKEFLTGMYAQLLVNMPHVSLRSSRGNPQFLFYNGETASPRQHHKHIGFSGRKPVLSRNTLQKTLSRAVFSRIFPRKNRVVAARLVCAKRLSVAQQKHRQNHRNEHCAGHNQRQTRRLAQKLRECRPEWFCNENGNLHGAVQRSKRTNGCNSQPLRDVAQGYPYQHVQTPIPGPKHHEGQMRSLLVENKERQKPGNHQRQ